ncbi:hypothetical protein [Winogradskyella sp.]|uniref:hypothetical protein n=1 Tax=Winogradskyella sp. TaxID=1883156 RepID=UPI002612288F|nr:hypothetical protein [Winogradskyella sp.]
MKKITLLSCLLLAVFNFGISQTTLSAGEVIVTGFNSDNPDEFTFVLLTDVTTNTEINFTDRGWQNSGSFRGFEGTLTWTATSDLPCGTEIVVTDNDDPFVASLGSITDSNSFQLATNGDQILVYQGTDASPTFIYGINFSSFGWSDATSANDTALPPGLTDGTNAVDVGNFDNGEYDCSITLNPVLILAANSDATNWTGNNATRFTMGGCTYSCTPCTLSTTWDGANWDNGMPNINTEVIINGNYTTDTDGGSFTCCSLTVNAGELRVSNGEFVEVVNDVVVEDSATLFVETSGSFIQNGDGVNAGSFTLNGTGSSTVIKFTSPLNNWYDYTYWSSPVANATINTALFAADPNRRFQFNANNFLDLNADDIDDDGNDWGVATGIMEVGRGYAATHSEIAFIPGPPVSYQYIFTGGFNTGDYSFPLAYNPVNTSHWNLAGNPYPSAIDVDLLFAGNTSIQNVVYLWSHFRAPLNSNPGNEVLNFSQSDYLTINATLELGNGSDLNGDNVVDALDIPERKIPSGQGFFVISSSANPILFTNSMRVSGNNENDDFYRNTTEPNTYNKLWLNLTSDNGAYSQTGIGYVEGATSDFDGSGYDARRQESTATAAVLYSRIDAINDYKFAIQGRAVEDISLDEVIHLGFINNLELPTIFSIKAIKYEGYFFSDNPIYLKDNLLNIVHDLKLSDYDFTSEVGEFKNRFEIVFTSEALSLDDNVINANELIITELSDGKVQISINEPHTINNVEILDVLGRQIYNLEGTSSTEVYNLSKLSNAAYIAKVTLSNGEIISKKAIKQH